MRGCAISLWHTLETSSKNLKLIIKIYRNNNRPRKELFRPLKLVDNFYYKFKQQLNSYHINTIKSYLVLLNSFIVKEDIKYNSDIRFRMARDAIRDTLRDIGLTQHIADNSWKVINLVLKDTIKSYFDMRFSSDNDGILLHLGELWWFRCKSNNSNRTIASLT